MPLGFVDDLNGIANCGPESANLNTFLNTQIDLKKLNFHTSNDSVGSKCLQMHIGKANEKCPKLKVDGQTMARVDIVTYLGDKISSDGKNTVNICDQVNKGVGLVHQIMKTIRNIGFGTSTIDTALLLRESLLINGMLTNAEIWHNLTKSETEEFEKVDRLFLQQLMRVP